MSSAEDIENIKNDDSVEVCDRCDEDNLYEIFGKSVEELNSEESVLETTTMSVIGDMGETDTEKVKDDLKIETSTGNDILMENLKRRKNKH